MRQKIIDSFFRFVMNNDFPRPERWLIYPDQSLPVRCLIGNRQCEVTGLKEDESAIIYHFADEKKWDERNCKHEWSLIGYRDRPLCGSKFELGYCNKCSSLMVARNLRKV